MGRLVGVDGLLRLGVAVCRPARTALTLIAARTSPAPVAITYSAPGTRWVSWSWTVRQARWGMGENSARRLAGEGEGFSVGEHRERQVPEGLRVWACRIRARLVVESR
jgi:hypothetical protein